MIKYATIVIQMPEDAEGKNQLQQGLELLKPLKTTISSEDKMMVLELIEQHEDFPEHIAEEARARAAELHAQAEDEVRDEDDLGPDPETEFIIANEARLEREHEHEMDGSRSDGSA